MVNLNRRFFLGGAISLVAASTFTPSVSAMMNLPTIYGDGVNPDAYGLAALFRKEPVVFKKGMIGVDTHGGIEFHHGSFLIDRCIDVPEDLIVNLIGKRINFIDAGVDPNEPFFKFPVSTKIYKYKKWVGDNLVDYGKEYKENHGNYYILKRGLFITKSVRTPALHDPNEVYPIINQEKIKEQDKRYELEDKF